jgi:Ner family transcriptional regulator
MNEMNRTDMHPADIIAQLKKRNLSLAAVSRQAGLSSSTLANTLSRPGLKGSF